MINLLSLATERILQLQDSELLVCSLFIKPPYIKIGLHFSYRDRDTQCTLLYTVEFCWHVKPFINIKSRLSQSTRNF